MKRSHGFVVAMVILALTVVQLAVGTFAGLEQYDGKGFGYRLVAYPVMMLAVPLAWIRWPGSTGEEHPWPAFALIMSPFLIDITGNTVNLYDTVEWWDNANHFVNWLLLLWGLGLLLRLLWTGPRWGLVLTITGLGAVLAITWELGEWYTFIRRGTELDGAYEDTLADELLGTLGALVAALIVGRKPPVEPVSDVA